jgi:hypothetical protein
MTNNEQGNRTTMIVAKRNHQKQHDNQPLYLHHDKSLALAFSCTQPQLLSWSDMQKNPEQPPMIHEAVAKRPSRKIPLLLVLQPTPETRRIRRCLQAKVGVRATRIGSREASVLYFVTVFTKNC